MNSDPCSTSWICFATFLVMTFWSINISLPLYTARISHARLKVCRNCSMEIVSAPLERWLSTSTMSVLWRFSTFDLSYEFIRITRLVRRRFRKSRAGLKSLVFCRSTCFSSTDLVLNCIWLLLHCQVPVDALRSGQLAFLESESLPVLWWLVIFFGSVHGGLFSSPSSFFQNGTKMFDGCFNWWVLYGDFLRRHKHLNLHCNRAVVGCTFKILFRLRHVPSIAPSLCKPELLPVVIFVNRQVLTSTVTCVDQVSSLLEILLALDL